VGHKIGEQNKQIADLEAKLDTKDKLLGEALQKIKDIHDDSTRKTETEPDTDDPELD
jgi:chromosome segregation ATPase